MLHVRRSKSAAAIYLYGMRELGQPQCFGYPSKNLWFQSEAAWRDIVDHANSVLL